MKKVLFLLLFITTICPSVIRAQQLSLSLGQGGAICRGDSAQLSGVVTGGAPPYYYHWTPTTGLSDSSISNPLASPTATITYTLFVKDSNSDSINHSVTITVNARPHAGFTVDTTYTNCPPLLCEFTNISTGIIIAFDFEFGDGTSSTLHSPPPHLYAIPGSYHPYLIAINSSGCTNTFYMPDSIVVGGPKVTSFSVTPTSGCAPLTVTSIIISNAKIFTWSFGDTSFMSNSDTTTHTYHYPGVYHNLVIISDSACNYPFYLDTIHVFSDTVSVISSNLTVCKGDTIPLEVTGANTYTVIPGLAQLNDSTFLAYPTVSTSYKIIGTDIHGCIDSTTAVVTVDTTCVSVGILTIQSPPAFNLSIYPNPSSDKIIVAFNKDIPEELLLQNLLGETVLMLKHLQQTNSVDVTALPSGIYSLIATSKQNRIVRKMVVQR